MIWIHSPGVIFIWNCWLLDTVLDKTRVITTETDNTALYTIKKTLITNMQNHLVHHLISTKLSCTLPKCTLVQNYIVNLRLHVRCQPPKYYRLKWLYVSKVSIVCSCAPNTDKVFACSLQLWTTKQWKMLGWPWCTMQVGGAQFSPVPTRWFTM